MADTGTYAACLLPHLTTPAAARVVLATATVTEPVTIPAPLPAEVLRAERNANVARAVTAARSATDPDVLDHLASDTRVTVQRAVAANPHVGPGTALRLWRVALERGDADLAYTVAEHVAIADACPLPARSKISADRLGAVSPLLARFSGDGYRAADAIALLSLGNQYVTRAVLLSVHRGDVAGVDLDTAVAAIARSDLRGDALAATMASASVVDASLTRHYLATGQGHASTMVSSRAMSGKAVVSDEAAELLLASGGPGLTFVSDRCLAPVSIEAAVAAIVERRDADAFARLIKANPSGITPDQAERAADACAGLKGWGGVALATVVAPLTTRTRHLAVMSEQDLAVAARFVVGEYANQLPRPGEVAGVIARCSEDHVRERLVTTISGLIQATGWTFPDVDEAADAFASTLLARALHDPAVAGYVTGRLASSLGDDEELWSIALGLIPTWEGPIGDLADTAWFTAGRTPPQSEPDVVVEDDGQLALLC